MEHVEETDRFVAPETTDPTPTPEPELFCKEIVRKIGVDFCLCRVEYLPDGTEVRCIRLD